MPSACIARRSSDWPGPGCVPSSPGLICSTGSGCAARIAGSTRATSSAPPTTMLASIGMEAFAERARKRAAGDGREGAQADGRDARRSDRAGAADRAAGRARACRIRRSVRGSSSARAPSSGICATCSPSSASTPAGSWLTHCLAPTLTWSRPDRKHPAAAARWTETLWKNEAAPGQLIRAFQGPEDRLTKPDLLPPAW